MITKQKKYFPTQKVEKVARFLQEREPIVEYCRRYEIDPDESGRWKSRFLIRGRDAFYYGQVSPEVYLKQIQRLEAEIEKLEIENIALKAMIRLLKDKEV